MNQDSSSIENSGSTDPTGTESRYARLVIRNPEGAVVTKDVLRSTTLIGSQSGCNVQLVSPDVAPVHCALTMEQDGLHVRQIRDAFPLRLNGAPADYARFVNGDEVQLGPFLCRLETNLPVAERRVEPARSDPAEQLQKTPSEEIGSESSPTGYSRLVIRSREGAVARKELSRHTTLIGGMSIAGLQLVAPEVSPAHCLITREAGGLRIRDLRSRSGTRVNGRPMEICRLRTGDCVELGPFVCRLETDLLPAETFPSDDRPDGRFEIDGVATYFEVERAKLEQVRADAERHTAESASLKQQLMEQLAAIQNSKQVAQAELQTAQRDRAILERDRNDLAAERDRIAEEAARLRKEQEELRALREFVSRNETALSEARHEFDQRVVDFDARVTALDARTRALNDDRLRFDKQVSGWESERARFEQQRERHAARMREFEEQSSRASTLQAELEIEKQRLASQEQKLLTIQNDAQLEQQRIEAERLKLAKHEEQIVASNAAIEEQKVDLQRSRAEFQRELERTSQVGADLTHERLGVSQDRARLEKDLQEIEALAARLRVDRERLQEDEQRQEMVQREMELQRESLARQEAALERATADLQERHEELLHRRQQLRAEQAFLRSGKRQFQGALHEFRAEQERFRRAISAVKRQRKELRLQRREVRAASQAGIPLDVTAIPFQSGWVSAGWLRGTTENNEDPPRLLDVGESASIYVAEEEVSGRLLAIKVIPLAQANASGRREIEMRWEGMLSVDHPNVVRSIRIDTGGTALCLAMESVDGINLGELIALHGALSWREAAGYAFQAALGLEAIHESGRIHENICPSHLMLEEDGTLKILASSISGGWNGSTLPVEQPGADPPEAVDYIAPEQTLDSSAVDCRADIYSLGCVLYQALTGMVPFPTGSALQRIESHQTKLPLPVRRFAPDVPKDLVLAVKRMTTRQPTDRYQSAGEVAQALAPFARRVPTWYNDDTILASRIERIREQLILRLTRDVLAPESPMDAG